MPITGQTTTGAQQDKIIAFDMLKDSKYCITGLTRAATEAANPQLRQFISSSLDECVQEHFRLADLMVSKGWYYPSDIQQQIQADLTMASQVTQNITNRS